MHKRTSAQLDDKDADKRGTANARQLVDDLIADGKFILAQRLSYHLMQRLDPQQVEAAVLAFQQDRDAATCQDSAFLLAAVRDGDRELRRQMRTVLKGCALIDHDGASRHLEEALQYAFAADPRHGKAFIWRVEQWRAYEVACTKQAHAFWQPVTDLVEGKSAGHPTERLVGSYAKSGDENPNVRMAWKLTCTRRSCYVELLVLEVGSEIQPLHAPSDLTLSRLPSIGDGRFYKRALPDHGATIVYNPDRRLQSVRLGSSARRICCGLGPVECQLIENGLDYQGTEFITLRCSLWDSSLVRFTPLPYIVHERWPEISRLLVELSGCEEHALGRACAPLHSGGPGGGFERQWLPLLRGYLIGDGDPARDALAFCRPIASEYAPGVPLPEPCICEKLKI